jgi:hypothetical protein
MNRIRSTSVSFLLYIHACRQARELLLDQLDRHTRLQGVHVCVCRAKTKIYIGQSTCDVDYCLVDL